MIDFKGITELLGKEQSGIDFKKLGAMFDDSQSAGDTDDDFSSEILSLKSKNTPLSVILKAINDNPSITDKNKVSVLARNLYESNEYNPMDIFNVNINNKKMKEISNETIKQMPFNKESAKISEKDIILRLRDKEPNQETGGSEYERMIVNFAEETMPFILGQIPRNKTTERLLFKKTGRSQVDLYEKEPAILAHEMIHSLVRMKEKNNIPVENIHKDWQNALSKPADTYEKNVVESIQNNHLNNPVYKNKNAFDMANEKLAYLGMLALAGKNMIPKRFIKYFDGIFN